MVAAPLRVSVDGRRGVGRTTVAHALRCAGVTVAAGADVVVYVLAEAVKPEDTAAVAAAGRPVLVVLNKAELAGPLSCADVSALTGAPVAPLAGLLAVAALDHGLDDSSCAALAALATEPAGPDPCPGLPRDVRARLCDMLGPAGVGHAVAAIRRGGRAEPVRTVLRRASGVDAVVAGIAAVGAEVRYRRLLDLVAGLEALAVTDARIAAVLSSDDVVRARMSAAVAVIEAAGLPVDSCEADPSDEGTAHLRRAVAWQRYSRGPVTQVHRACANDIVRGSLRRWSAVGGAR